MAAEPTSTQTLGQYLRQERERRGITIEQVSSATRINVRQLHLLEADQYAELPAKPYVRGFVISYARFMGLDVQAILTRFGSFLEIKAEERPRREAGHVGYAFEKREGEQSRTLLWIIMGGFVVLGGVLIFVLKPTLKHHRPSRIEKLKEAQVKASPSPHVSPASPFGGSPVAGVTPAVASPSPVVVTPTGVPSPVPTPTPRPSPSPSSSVSEPPDPLNSGLNLLPSELRYRVIFKALEDVWVRYRVDDRPSMKFPLRKGRILVLKARTQIFFQTSDAKSVSYNLNNTGFKVLETEKNRARRQGSASLSFPFELLEKTQELFPGERLLPDYPPPVWRRASPSPAPSP